MPEVPIPGMAFRARLSKKGGANVVELLFRGNPETSNEVSGNLTESGILSSLKQGCIEAGIEHQVADIALNKVAGDLFKEAGLGEGKTLVPAEFELTGEATEIDRKLAIIIREVQKLHKRLDKLESLIEFGPEAK
jgi:hypothetical protein